MNLCLLGENHCFNKDMMIYEDMKTFGHPGNFYFKNSFYVLYKEIHMQIFWWLNI